MNINTYDLAIFEKQSVIKKKWEPKIIGDCAEVPRRCGEQGDSRGCHQLSEVAFLLRRRTEDNRAGRGGRADQGEALNAAD